jgi:ribosomal protein S18 acetylase RimI-like enzyme
MNIRALRRDDRPCIERLLHDTQVFTDAEIACALELIDVYLNVSGQRDYLLACAVDDADVAQGYVCYGPTPLTDAVWDLYWIAVAPARQRHGVGKLLLGYVEAQMHEHAGRRLMIETSSLPRYLPTRNFYLRHGYSELARIADFYAIGDDRIIYGKDFPLSKKAR